jgi:hypothetical protein
VNRRHSGTPAILIVSMACRADRRRNPTPINILELPALFGSPRIGELALKDLEPRLRPIELSKGLLVSAERILGGKPRCCGV